MSDFINRHFKWFTLGPAALLLLLLTVYPIINLFFMAVSTIRFEQAQEVWLFTPYRNFQTLINDEIFRIALINTVIFAVASVIIETVLGLAIAILVASVTAFKGIMRTVLIIPVLMPPVAIGSMWKLMYSYDFGVFNQFFTWIGYGPVNWLGSPSLALISVIIVDIWHWTPFVFLILFAAVEGLPKEVIEAARVDGATNRDITFKIIIPLLKPAIAVAMLFRTILAFKVFDQIFLLTSGGPGTSTEVVSLHLYKVFFAQNDMGYGAMLSLAVIAATIAFLLVGQRASAAFGGKN
ncbi:carbohydrate ABC transporter permease [Rhizobium sp. SSA_523]|uniref:carbohydrate ABC transporter permease n=1 Tax=Rhizobium sp. SSA_523 TaxID=2952477 RepID=UPI00209088B9|nr:sugar ABC transporter permease [Rhizobium sp. SSA_523]MCO5734169.1 sugar ABC transporter permease [Rhizobium sp. SSA_523]WKC21550.1 sugar ABC transporter permease [Rhizobium sp. SSA_523]